MMRFKVKSSTEPLWIEFQNPPEGSQVFSLDLDTMWSLTGIIKSNPQETVFLTSASRVFCAGLDLRQLVELGTGQELLEGLVALFGALQSHPAKVVSLVSGPATGGGVGLALSADVVIVSSDAYFRLPHEAYYRPLAELLFPIVKARKGIKRTDFDSWYEEPATPDLLVSCGCVDHVVRSGKSGSELMEEMMDRAKALLYDGKQPRPAKERKKFKRSEIKDALADAICASASEELQKETRRKFRPFLIFLSFSKRRSRLAAEALAKLIKSCFGDSVKVFLSSNDIGDGEQWVSKVWSHLEPADMVVSVLSPENAVNPWIQAEAAIGLAKDRLRTFVLQPYKKVMGAVSTSASPFTGRHITSGDARRLIDEIANLTKTPSDKRWEGRLMEFNEGLERINEGPTGPLELPSVMNLSWLVDEMDHPINALLRDKLLEGVCEELRTLADLEGIEVGDGSNRGVPQYSSLVLDLLKEYDTNTSRVLAFCGAKGLSVHAENYFAKFIEHGKRYAPSYSVCRFFFESKDKGLAEEITEAYKMHFEMPISSNGVGVPKPGVLAPLVSHRKLKNLDENVGAALSRDLENSKFGFVLFVDEGRRDIVTHAYARKALRFTHLSGKLQAEALIQLALDVLPLSDHKAKDDTKKFLREIGQLAAGCGC